MKKYSLKEIAKNINGNLYGSNLFVNKFSTDSRNINNGDVFICLKGKNYDGHDFIEDSLLSASCIISSKNIHNINLKKNSYIKVDDTLKALQDLSLYVRQQSKAKFIAITGSNGKTTVKEMVAHILSDYNVTYTKGNFNNHIGVPITLLSLNNDEDFVVIEAGANKLGEIDILAKLIQPDVAAVTNIGYAHIEGFGNLENTAKEKYSLFNSVKKDGVIVINSQDKYHKKIISKSKKIYFGNCENFLSKVKRIIKNLFYKKNFLYIKKINNNTMELKYLKYKESFKLNLNGEHNFSNSACAASIAISLGISLKDIKKKLETFRPVSSRLKMHKLDNNITIIDDCYNANPSSFKVAISFLSSVNEKKLVLMGDMVELGDDTKKFHTEIGEYAKAHGVSKLLSIGSYSKFASDVFGKEGYHFENSERLKNFLIDSIDPYSCILIKGSRSSKLEEYVEFLKNRSNK